MSFQKFILIAKNTLQEYFTYRVNFAFWRLQVFISFITFYSLWSAVGQSSGFSSSLYTLPQLYAYFIIGYIIRALVFSTRTADIGGDIQNGNLATLLLKPIGTIKYYFSRDLVDKLFNLTFMIVEFSLILLLLKPQLVFPSPTNCLLFVLAITFSILIFFFYSLIVSFVTFWSDNAWSSRFLFGVVFVNLFSGQFIPLDMLPPQILTVLNFTPVPYLYFYPVKIWLGQTIPANYLLITPFILLSVYLISSFLWQKGKVKFQSYGN